MRQPQRLAAGMLMLTIALASVAPVGAARPSADADRWLWPASGRISQAFGCTGAWTNGRVGRCAHFHNGVDIANRGGTPVVAARAGVVRFVGYNPHDPPRHRAWIVIVDHGALRSWYAHLQPRRVKGALAGDRVAAGDLLGYMGATGRATGVHLHFGIERNGHFLDPRDYLPGRSRDGDDKAGGHAPHKPRQPRPTAAPDTQPKPRPKSQPTGQPKPKATTRPKPQPTARPERPPKPVVRPTPKPQTPEPTPPAVPASPVAAPGLSDVRGPSAAPGRSDVSGSLPGNSAAPSPSLPAVPPRRVVIMLPRLPAPDRVIEAPVRLSPPEPM